MTCSRAPRERRFVVDRDVASRAIELSGLGVIVVGSFGPWLRSGERLRTSYELFQVADRLGFLGEGLIGWLPRCWVWMPLVASLALGCHVLDRHRLGDALAAVVAVCTLAVTGGVLASPLPSEWGSLLGLVGAATTLVGVVSAAVASLHASARPPRRDPS